MHKNYNLSIGVMFRNELHIMEEWVKHYLRIGADHIYMINHESSDNYMDILSTYINDGKVTLFQNRRRPERLGQINAYNEFVTPHVKGSQWFAFLDMDEFLYSRKNNNIVDILNDSEYNAYSVPWLNFGSNGLLGTPKSAIKSFTKRMNYNLDCNKYYKTEMRQIKTVFNTDVFKRVVELHYVGEFKKRHEVKKRLIADQVRVFSAFNEYSINNMDLAINHYSVQAMNWFNNIKGQRLSANGCSKKYTIDYFHKMDTNHKDDITLLKQYEENN